MVLVIDTTEARVGKSVMDALSPGGHGGTASELVEAQDLRILPCVGCNHCWLKTPGICSIKDDMEPILRKMSEADQVWYVTDTVFGFVSHQTKNLVDRVLPLVTMYLEFRDREMRHVMRYEHRADIGLIYTGEGERPYLERWLGRVCVNMGCRALGVFDATELKEATSCMS